MCCRSSLDPLEVILRSGLCSSCAPLAAELWWQLHCRGRASRSSLTPRLCNYVSISFAMFFLLFGWWTLGQCKVGAFARLSSGPNLMIDVYGGSAISGTEGVGAKKCPGPGGYIVPI